MRTVINTDSQEIVECTDCGSVGYQGEAFCACCGSIMEKSPHRCPRCRQEIAHSIANFCPHCGEELDESGEGKKSHRL